MKLGVVFPQIESGTDLVALKDYAQTAEGLGYDYLLLYDHVLGANPARPGGWAGRPYDYEDPFYEPFVFLSYIAGFTQTLELVTGILILPQRQTALVAKQAATLDRLSGGRLRLGVGIGWNEVEYQALNETFTNRGARIEEQIEVLKKLWTDPLVTFEGKYHHIADAGLNPMPVQRPIPIWFGGMADIVLKRMARLGDGWMPGGQPGPTLQQKMDQLQGYLRDEGRDPQTFGIDCRISVSNSPQSAWAEQAETWRDFGATHLAVNTMGAGFTSMQEHIKAIRAFKETVS